MQPILSQFCTPDQAQELFDLGIRHPDTLFWWNRARKTLVISIDNTEEMIPMYTASDIGAMLPWTESKYPWRNVLCATEYNPAEETDAWCCYWQADVPIDGQKCLKFWGNSEAEARTNLLLQVLNTRFTIPEACNDRLEKYIDDSKKRTSHQV